MMHTLEKELFKVSNTKLDLTYVTANWGWGMKEKEYDHHFKFSTTIDYLC